MCRLSTKANTSNGAADQPTLPAVPDHGDVEDHHDGDLDHHDPHEQFRRDLDVEEAQDRHDDPYGQRCQPPGIVGPPHEFTRPEIVSPAKQYTPMTMTVYDSVAKNAAANPR